MRIAQITSGQDDADLATIKQLMEMTSKSEDQVAVALHDCENDLERAVLMLLEGQNDQGEWKEQGKKKKRTNPAVPIPKTEPTSNHVSEKTDSKRDRSRDDDRPDRYDGPPRRGRRNGGPPPRLARGRGRDRNNQFGDRNAEGDNERDGFRNRDGFRDRGNFRDGFNQDRDGFRDSRDGRDSDGFRDREQDGFRDRGENGFGGFGGRDRSGDRGRGRGRGGNSGRRGGRGRGGGGFKSEGRPQRFDRGPQIDTWTNETAENADKEPAGWGETWESSEVTEDWNDDSWQGPLTESKVFTATAVKEDPLPSAPMNDITSSIGQTNSLGQQNSGPLGQPGSIGQPSSLRQPGSLSASGSLGQSGGLGQASTLGQRLDLGSLLKTAEQHQQHQQQANDTLIAQYNQQATESIKNSIGIGSPSRGNLSNLPSQSAPSGLSSYSQNLQASSGMAPPPPQSLSAQQLSVQQPPPHVQQGLQQRPKPQRSKLPPPSKIPASAVEMPGHVMPQLDVQFGVDFGADSSSPFSFGSSESAVTASGFATTTQTSAVSMSNHLGQVSKASDSVMSATGMMSSPGPKQAPSISGLEHSSPRTSVFQSTAYNTTPPKKDAPSPLNQQTKMTPPEPIPFPPSQSDLKSSPLMTSQRPTQAAVSLSQGSLATVKTDAPSLSSFVQSSGNYQSSSYQGHKPSGLNSTQAYTHTTSSQGSSFSSQYQPSQNQYQTGQNQYSAGSNQYQSGTNQYPSYPSGAASFQSQTNFSPSQANQNSLYPTPTQASSYQAQTGSSYHVRDSQSSSVRQSSTNSSNTSYPNQATGLTSPPSQTQPSSVSAYNSQSAYSSTGHQSSLQTSPLTGNKLGDSLSKMTLKDSITDAHPSSQYDHTTTTTSTTPASLPTTTSSTSLSSIVSTIASTTIASVVSGASRSTLPTTKAPPNLPPGVPLLSHQYIGVQGAIPPFYVSNPSQQNLQQQLYPATGYEDMQLLQQRLPLANSYYDMSGFPVPSTIGGQDRATLGSVPYSGSTDSSKLNRVEAQSPNPTSQQQNTQSAQHPFINLQYGYYYPSVLPGAAGFQYPTMFPQMPPVTNTAHAGTTATTQFQKSYASHGYNTAKGYEDLTQAQDFTKSYGAAQTQTKGSAGTRTATAADLATSAYGKSHTQGFDKQAFHAGTPPPFNLPMATQAGAMGGPTTPYVGAPFVPMMAHQPHSQMLHHPLQQDSTGGTARAQQATSQAKAGTKPYGTYWGSS